MTLIPILLEGVSSPSGIGTTDGDFPDGESSWYPSGNLISADDGVSSAFATVQTNVALVNFAFSSGWTYGGLNLSTDVDNIKVAFLVQEDSADVDNFTYDRIAQLRTGSTVLASASPLNSTAFPANLGGGRNYEFPASTSIVAAINDGTLRFAYQCQGYPQGEDAETVWNDAVLPALTYPQAYNFSAGLYGFTELISPIPIAALFSRSGNGNYGRVRMNPLLRM